MSLQKETSPRLEVKEADVRGAGTAVPEGEFHVCAVSAFTGVGPSEYTKVWRGSRRPSLVNPDRTLDGGVRPPAAVPFEQKIENLNGMEYKRRQGWALRGMRALAVLALVMTVLYLVPAVIVWMVRYRNRREVMKRAVVRWYLGPPLSSSILFDGLSKTLRSIREGAPGFQALHHIYNWLERHLWTDVDLDGDGLGGKLANWWINMTNAQAVRNRRILVIAKSVEKFRLFADTHPGQVLRILSIACGSAQPMLEALVQVREYLQERGVTVELRLLDNKQAPLDHAIRLARHFGVDAWVVIQYYKTDAKNAASVCDDGQWVPWFVEVVGLVDYFDDHHAIALFTMIYNLLADGGWVLTGHILDNDEAFVLRWLIAWAMRYRQPIDLGRLVAAGGFDPFAISLHLEVLRIHVLAEATKV